MSLIEKVNQLKNKIISGKVMIMMNSWETASLSCEVHHSPFHNIAFLKECKCTSTSIRTRGK